jgi:ribosome-associated protein
VTADGLLVLTSDEYRSQSRNRDAVLARFAALLAAALRPERPRRPTRRPLAAQQRRLQAKRRQSEKKAHRRPPEAGEQ